MKIEFEATFEKIEKNKIREKLKVAEAKLIKPEFMQKRIVFKMPKGHELQGGWLRVRDEGDRITMSLKKVDGNQIHNQKEIQLVVNDFEEARNFLLNIGAIEKAYQETKRELWLLDGVEVAIDEWPYLEPFVEVEGGSEEDVKSVSEKLGFDYSKALFCAVGTLYSRKYKVSEDIINNQTALITFKDPNPFA